MAGQVVKVKRETLEACITCPLCNKLLREATTISLCLHSFCRKCIYDKLSDEEVDCCPVCNIDLGCLPVEKLRPDHNLQDIRAKIFPFKRQKILASEVMPSISLPAKRKERSLSSLVVSTPKVPLHTGLTGKRTKGSARKATALRGCELFVEGKKEDSAEDCPMSSSSPDSLNKLTQNRRQESSKAGPSNGDMENDGEMIEGKADLWTPLNCLVEAANRTKSSKLNSQGQSLAKSDLHNAPDSEMYITESKAKVVLPNVPGSEGYLSKTKMKELGQKTKFHDNKNGMGLLPGPVKRRRLHAAARKRETVSNELCATAQAMLATTGTKHKRKNNPIWFSLIASEDQKGDASLPQISTCYLRIKDGQMPVSFIMKYLVKKLGLTSETEVEIFCCDQPVVPTLQLHNLVDFWFRTASTSKKVPAFVGSSAKDFVMVLSYCRKVQAS